MEKQFDIIDTALSAGNFSTLAAALGAAGLIETSKGSGPFTVFAPTDDAFSKIPSETLSELLQPENKEKLIAILTYHVVSGRMDRRWSNPPTWNMPQSLQGQTLKISTKDGVTINDAIVLTADVKQRTESFTSSTLCYCRLLRPRRKVSSKGDERRVVVSCARDLLLSFLLVFHLFFIFAGGFMTNQLS